MMMGGPGMGALFSEEGAKDIGLSEQQTRQIQQIMRESRPEPGAMRFPGPNASQEDREKFQKEMEKRMQDSISKVEKVFTPEQLEKARARAFQAGGGYGSLGMNPFAQAAVGGLTEEQKTKIRAAQREQMESMRREFENAPRPDFQNMTQEERDKFREEMQARMEALRPKMEENRKKLEETIKGVLNEDQRAKAEKMLGETPEYIKKAVEAGPQGWGGNRGNRGGGDRPGGGNFRPGADSWRPGQGVGGDDDEDQPRRRGTGFPRRN